MHLNAPFLSPIVPKFFARFLTGDRERRGGSRLLGRVEAMASRSQIFSQKGGFYSTVLPVQPKLKQNAAEFTLACIPQFARCWLRCERTTPFLINTWSGRLQPCAVVGPGVAL